MNQNQVSRDVLGADTKRTTTLADLDGLSIKDAKRMPHATLLSKWSDAGLYTIDVNLGVFKVRR